MDASARKEKIGGVITTSGIQLGYSHLRDQQRLAVFQFYVQAVLKSLPLLGSKKDCQDFYVHQLFHANPQVVAQQTLVQGSIISKSWLDDLCTCL